MSSQAPKLAHPLPLASTSAAVKIGHVQLRDLVHSTGPRGRVAYVTDKGIKEVDVRRGVQSTRTLASLDFQPNCIALSPSGGLVVAGGQRAELQFTTVAPPPHPSLSRRRTRKGPSVSDERCKARKSSQIEESDSESDEEIVDETMGWSMDGSEATRTRRVEVHGARYRDIASINNHVLVLGDSNIDGGIYGQGPRVPDQTRIIVSNNDEHVRIFDVDTRESASSKEWGTIEQVGIVNIGTAANHVSISPDGRTMLAVGDDTRLQIFSVNARSALVDLERVGSYTSGTEPNFTTAWSASGLQFASASQDGTVTVWDVRSSSPLNSWRVPQRTGYRPHSPDVTPERSASPPASIYASQIMRAYDARYAGAYHNTDQFLWDPSTQGPGHGIRSLKFSPASGNREMLVFTEHTAHVHIVDAQTFSEHQILDVPRAPRIEAPSPVRNPVGLPAPGADCGYSNVVNVGHGYYIPAPGKDSRGEREVDLTGVTFDRTGKWMYVGTERSVVEYEMVTSGRRGRSYDAFEWA